ncbi:MAG: type II CAAX endopeptidase family protein, partial [Calditrichaceae bacterium]
AFSLVILFTLFHDLLAYLGWVGEKNVKSLQYFYIFGESLFIIVPVFYARYRQYNIKKLFRIRPVSIKVIVLSILIGITLSILSDELDRIINLFFEMPDWLVTQSESLKASNTLEFVLTFTGIVLVASIAEEGMFRGFLQYSLEKHGDVTRAVLLSSIAWTLIHMNVYWSIQLFLMGVVIGYLAWRTKSLIPGIIIHAMNNFIGVVFLNFNLSPYMNWYEQNNHVSPVVLVIAAGILFWSVNTINKDAKRLKFGDEQ